MNSVPRKCQELRRPIAGWKAARGHLASREAHQNKAISPLMLLTWATHGAAHLGVHLDCSLGTWTPLTHFITYNTRALQGQWGRWAEGDQGVRVRATLLDLQAGGAGQRCGGKHVGPSLPS